MAVNFAGGSMKCSHLKGKKVQTCTVSRQIYMPSLFELEEFCHTAMSARCPLLIRRAWGDQIPGAVRENGPGAGSITNTPA